MNMKSLIPLFFCAGLLLLQSCYCSRAIPLPAGGHPKFLQSAHSTFVRELCFSGNGRGNEISAYYGFPSYQLSNLKNHYASQGLINLNGSTKGQFGFRYNHYIAPPFTQLAIMRIGLDYSHATQTLNFDNTLSEQTNLHFISNRIMFNTSIYTFVNLKGLAGYVQLQGGANFLQKNHEGNALNFNFTDSYSTTYFDYQVGYGIQYFPLQQLSFFTEAGYGTGVYVKTGINFSF
jgi:hypothetical protein